jgi:hypothetical protein
MMRVQTTRKPKLRRGVRVWIMDRLINPVVSAILRSRLHRPLSGTLVLLSYEGHQSAHEYALPVQYARSDEQLYIVVGDANAKTWWRNLRGGWGVRLWLQGRKALGRADVLSDVAEAEQGLRVYLDRFPGLAVDWGVRHDARGAYAVEDLRRVGRGLVVVRINLDVLPR